MFENYICLRYITDAVSDDGYTGDFFCIRKNFMKCVFCNQEYEKLSEEHIIPNVLCGTLKSQALICSKCNSLLGEHIDAELQKSFAWLINLFALEKERGNYYAPVEAKSNGRKCLLKHGGIPEYDDIVAEFREDINGKKILHFSAPPNKKLLLTEVPKFIAQNKSVLEEAGVDYKDFIPKVLSQIKDMSFAEMSIEPEYDNKMNIGIHFGGNDFFLAILKIAFMYACFHKTKFNRQAIVRLLSEKSQVHNVFFFCGEQNLFSYDLPGVYHSLAINTSDDGKRLFVSVELFSLVSYIVLLDDDYQGDPIYKIYGYDLIHKTECTPVFLPIRSNNMLNELCVENFANSQSIDHLRKNVIKLLRLLGILNFHSKMKNEMLKNNMIPEDAKNFFDQFIEDMQNFWRTHLGQIALLPDSMLPALAQNCMNVYFNMQKQYLQ